MLVREKENLWHKSLTGIKATWDQNLNKMEKTVKAHKSKLLKIKKGPFLRTQDIDKELHEAFHSPKIPNLDLKKIKNEVNKPHTHRLTSINSAETEDLLSNRSAFSKLTDNGSVSYRLNKYKPDLPEIIQNNSVISDENASIEFDKVMAEISHHEIKYNPNSISMEKTIGGWKSEYESESEQNSLQINAEEIKRALQVLKSANLLEKGNNKILLKMAEVLKDPENSENLELMLQLLNLSRNQVTSKSPYSKRTSNSNSSILKKPPTPSNRWKRRLQIQSTSEANSELAGTTPRSVLFSEEQESNRTMLFAESILSARQHQAEEALEVALDKLPSEELHDVRLEDLLNVTSLGNTLGLKSVDTSLKQEDSVVVEKEVHKLPQKKTNSFKLDSDEFRHRLRIVEKERKLREIPEIMASPPSGNKSFMPYINKSIESSEYNSVIVSGSTRDTSGLRSRISIQHTLTSSSSKLLRNLIES